MMNFIGSSTVKKWLSVAAVALCVANVSDALPSFGTKIPNGELVPCPTSLAEEESNGCTASGFCLGLGHPKCGGFSPEDKTEGNPSTIILSPFGEDWRSNGFVWTKELCELDSDGDGFTNGEELGDPCCVWTTSSQGAMLDSVEGFAPSHPGMKDDVPPVGFTYDKASLCEATPEDPEEADNSATDADAEADAEAEADPTAYDEYYNPGESRGQIEFRVKPYPIPIKTTTYVDFVFNLPEDLPDIFHVVKGEAIIDQPKHLHHFVLFGCTTPIDPALEGMPLESPPYECQQIGLGGWAPGADLFGIKSLDTGVAIGRAMGIKALALNVHYTDGVYADAESKTHVMATDGIRIHYTEDFRPYTGFSKNVMWVPYGPSELVVPPNESRFFLSKTCNVNTSCKDARDDQLEMVASFMGVSKADAGIEDLTCSSIQAFCFMGGEIGSAVQRLCPSTCGLCSDGADGKPNSRNPGSYHISSVNYHAHLLGTEMYSTLLHENDELVLEQDISKVQKEAPLATGSTTDALKMKYTVKDLKSREVWYYDDQATIPMDYDILVPDPNDAATTTLARGVEVKPGDKIQTTCVYDSRDRTKATRFGLSTYDEMCVIGFFVKFETPESLFAAANDGEDDAAGAAGAVNIYTDLMLHSFACDSDEEFRTTDVYQGFLNETEDGRNVWFEHPIEDSDTCIFPVVDLVIADSILTMETRNCEKEEKDDVCRGFSSSDNVRFKNNAVAGHRCEGGTFDEKDSNEGVTEEDCLEVGGGTAYTEYTCADIEFWLKHEAQYELIEDEMTEYLRLNWWQPKCCKIRNQDDDDDDDDVKDICDGMPSSDDVEFLKDTIAGYTCQGGEFDQKDSSEGVTEKDCLEVGGGTSYSAYTCEQVQYWLQIEAPGTPGMTSELIEYLRSTLYQPKCCRQESGNGEPTNEDSEGTDPLPSTDPLSSTGARMVAIYGHFLAFLTAAMIVAMI